MSNIFQSGVKTSRLEPACDVQYSQEIRLRELFQLILASHSNDYLYYISGRLGIVTPCERMESYHRETRLYRDGSISLLEYQVICPGHNIGL